MHSFYQLTTHESPLTLKRIQSLLSLTLGNPDRIHQVFQTYQTDENRFLYFVQAGNDILGILGIQLTGNHGEILHIAVDSSYRHQGIGQKMIQAVRERYLLRSMIAETDKDAVEFYRKCGFRITSLGEKYPGVERFLCRWEQ